MAHCIEDRDSQYGVEKAWHGLTRLRSELKRDEVFPEFHREPVYRKTGEGFVPLVCDSIKWETLIAADDNLSGIPIPESYRVFSPREGWDTLEHILSGTRFRVISAGTLKNRSRFFISVQLDELQEVSRGMADAHHFTLNLWSGLDRSLSPVINLSSVRIVCQNTLQFNRDDKKSHLFKTRLTSGFDTRLQDSTPELEKIVGMAAVFRRTIENLGNIKTNVEQARNVYAGFLVSKGGNLSSSKGKNDSVRSSRTQNTVDELVSLFRNGIGNRGETRLDILNGFTQLYTRGSEESKKDRKAALESSEDGRWADLKSEFFDTIQNEFNETAEKGRHALAAAAN